MVPVDGRGRGRRRWRRGKARGKDVHWRWEADRYKDHRIWIPVGKLETRPELGDGGGVHRGGNGNELASRKGVPAQLAILRER